ncbi:MAG: hypothetical protein R3F34_20020 [Planctomycetota bacterium]
MQAERDETAVRSGRGEAERPRADLLDDVDPLDGLDAVLVARDHARQAHDPARRPRRRRRGVGIGEERAGVAQQLELAAAAERDALAHHQRREHAVHERQPVDEVAVGGALQPADVERQAGRIVDRVAHGRAGERRLEVRRRGQRRDRQLARATRAASWRICDAWSRRPSSSVPANRK